MAENGAFELAELGTRFESESEQGAARIAVCSERLGLAAAAIEREHERCPEPFAVGVLADQGSELGDKLLAMPELELALDAGFDGRNPELFEAPDLLICVAEELEVRECRAPPKRRGLRELSSPPALRRLPRTLQALQREAVRIVTHRVSRRRR